MFGYRKLNTSTQNYSSINANRSFVNADSFKLIHLLTEKHTNLHFKCTMKRIAIMSSTVLIMNMWRGNVMSGETTEGEPLSVWFREKRKYGWWLMVVWELERNDSILHYDLSSVAVYQEHMQHLTNVHVEYCNNMICNIWMFPLTSNTYRNARLWTKFYWSHWCHFDWAITLTFN